MFALFLLSGLMMVYVKARQVATDLDICNINRKGEKVIFISCCSVVYFLHIQIINNSSLLVIFS